MSGLKVQNPYQSTSVLGRSIEEARRKQEEVDSAIGDFDFIPGALASFVSSIPELFGAEAPSSVEAWRQENPVADIATQLAGFAIPYAGMYRVSKIPSLAKKLDGAVDAGMAAFKTTATRAPIRAGAMKEFLRYSPLELTRLGTGYALDADMGNMWADVAISQGLAGALGGLGGYLRAGGKAIEGASKLADAPEGLLPTFQLRLAREGSEVLGGQSIEQFKYSKLQETLTYVPESPAKGLKGRYLYDLENASPATAGWVEKKLFKPNGSSLSDEALEALELDVRQLHENGGTWGLGEGVSEAVAKQAGFDSVEELASHAVYPRLVTPKAGRNGAPKMGGMIGKMLDEGSLKMVDDGVLMGQEDGGLWLVMKRLEQGPTPDVPAGKSRRPAYQHGPAGVRPLDKWLVLKTDKPGKFAPKAEKVREVTVAQWAKMKDPFRQLKTENPFARQMNQIEQVLDPTDWMAATTQRRKSWTAGVAPKIAERMKAEGGIADLQQVQSLTEHLYDVIAPKARKMRKDPVYGRMLTQLEGGMLYAKEVLNKSMHGTPVVKESINKTLRGRKTEFAPFEGHRPIDEIIVDMDDDDFQLVMQAAITQTPAEDLAKLRPDGRISPKTEKLVAELQAQNRHMIETKLMPALEEAGMADQFQWLDGYIAPRVYKGDNMVRLTDEAGKLQWIVDGHTPKEAQDMAKAFVAQAADEGKVWKASKVESRAFTQVDPNSENLDQLYSMVDEAMGNNRDVQETVQRAMRRYNASTSGPALRVGGKPSTMKTRTGIGGSPDVQTFVKEDVVESIKNHHRQLLNYAAFHSWKHRYGHQALLWGKNNELAYTDLMRKAGQYLGVESQMTHKLNEILRPVLGSVLGGKPATKIAAETNKLMYAWQLGILNPTFALLNLLTPLQTVAPWISFMQSAPESRVAGMMQMSLRFDQRGNVAGYNSVLSPIKVLKDAIKMGGNPTDEALEFYSRALSDGTLNPQLYDEVIGKGAKSIHSLRNAAAQGGWEFIKEAATLMSTRSEQFSRLVAFNSGYLVGKNMFGLADDALYRFARKATETTMYGYGITDRARLLTGPVGSMFGLFKNWQFHFIDSMMEYASVAKHDNVWGPMLWQHGAALSLGGLGATPLVLMADGLAKWEGEHPNSFYWLQDNWNGPAGDAVYFGLPALAGMSLQASSALPGTDVLQDVETLTNVVFWQRAQQAWSGVAEGWDYYTNTGDNPLKNSNIRDKLIGGFAPRAVARAFSTTEGDYIKSMSTGSPTVRGLTPVQKVLHGAGFNMTEIEKHYIVGEDFYKKQEAKRERIQALGKAFAEAQLNGDRDAMTAVARRAVASGVPVDSVLKSADTRVRREQEGTYLSRFSKEDQAAAMQVLDR